MECKQQDPFSVKTGPRKQPHLTLRVVTYHLMMPVATGALGWLVEEQQHKRLKGVWLKGAPAGASCGHQIDCCCHQLLSVGIYTLHQLRCLDWHEHTNVDKEEKTSKAWKDVCNMISLLYEWKLFSGRIHKKLEGYTKRIHKWKLFSRRIYRKAYMLWVNKAIFLLCNL